MYEIFEHTADIGLRIRCDSLNNLFVDAGRGLTSLLIENPSEILGQSTRELSLSAQSLDYQFFDWLNELLYVYETEQWLTADYSVHIAESGVQATLKGEHVDRTRHRLAHEVKAITYHQLTVEQVPDGWLAEVILDI